MKKLILFLFTIFLSSISALSQDISGDWTGFLYQDTGGTSGKYTFTMKLEQTGTNISGISEIRLIDQTNIFGKILLIGSSNNNIFTFEETNISSQNVLEGMVWCIKYGTLNYSETNNYAYLQGNWKAIRPATCAPGTIFLKKKLDKKENNEQQENNVDTVELVPERQLTEGKHVKITTDNFEVRVYDHNKVDNDTISLYFNDKLILHKHRLTKEHKVINLTIDPQIQHNKLVLHAHNIGNIPPNTAAIIIKTTQETKKIILNSTMKQSDVIYFDKNGN